VGLGGQKASEKMMSEMSNLDILRMQAEALKRHVSEGAYEPEHCPHCGSKNWELLEADEYECYDCGQLFKESLRGREEDY